MFVQKFLVCLLAYVALPVFAKDSCPAVIPASVAMQLQPGVHYKVIDWPMAVDPWHTDLTESLELEAFQNWVSSHVHPEPIELLQRQMELMKVFPGAAEKIGAVIAGEVGRIGPLNCLEAALMTLHLREFNRTDEFSAFVLEREGALRVHMMSQGELFVERSEEFDRRIERDLSQGWVALAHLHNHPFLFDNSSGDIAGVIIPSDPDIAHYRSLKQNWGLENAWVTNGFDTFRLRHDEYARIKQFEEAAADR